MRDALKREVRELRSWYDLALKKRGRTTVGVSGLNMEELVDFIGAFLDGIPKNPRLFIPVVINMFRLVQINNRRRYL